MQPTRRQVTPHILSAVGDLRWECGLDCRLQFGSGTTDVSDESDKRCQADSQAGRHKCHTLRMRNVR